MADELGRDSMTDLVVAAIKNAGRPLNLDELEKAVLAAGFEHGVPTKNPRQLRASISALPHKSTRVRRVARGMYDVAEGQRRDA